MNEQQYRSAPGVNFSTLKHMAKSALHYRDVLANGIDDKPAWALGRAAHTAVLEPMSWMSRYIIKPETIERQVTKKKVTTTEKVKFTKAAPEWKEFIKSANGREIITQDQHDRAVEISRAVLLNPTAAELFRARPKTEVVIFWERFGIPLKSKLDIVAPGKFVADLKSTRDITPRFVDQEIMRRDYLAQFAFYADAWHAHTGEALPFFAPFVESVAPFDVDVVAFSEEDIEYGRKTYEGWLHTLIECTASGNWPGVNDGSPRLFQRPAWSIELDSDEILLGEDAA